MNLRYLLILLNEYPTVVSKWVKYTGSLVRKCEDQKNNQSSIHLIINLKLKLTLLFAKCHWDGKNIFVYFGKHWLNMSNGQYMYITCIYHTVLLLAVPFITVLSQIFYIIIIWIFQIYDLFAFFLAFLFLKNHFPVFFPI